MKTVVSQALLSTFTLLLGCTHALPSPSTAPESTAFRVKITGAGRVVVFLPDIGAPGEMWDTTIAHLGGRVEAHVVEVAGFAGNARVAAPLVPRLREGLARYLRERRAQGAILVGHMFGASVAYCLAMTDPDLVAGVVAIDAPPSRGDGQPNEETEGARRALSRTDPQQFAAMLRTRTLSAISDPTIARRLADEIVLSSQSAYVEAFSDVMTRDLRAQIPDIRASVLLILTTDNFPAEARAEVEAYHRQQLQRIPRHQLVVVPGSRHFVMFDQPAAFFAHLDRFLASVAGP